MASLEQWREKSQSYKFNDLSFNLLDGTIAVTLQNLPRLRFMFLSHNSITGEVPDWILSSNRNFDLSYNNFTHSSQVGCQFSTISLAGHSFFINCGEGRTRFAGNKYDENLSNLGPSHFEWNDRWACSSTGPYTREDNAPYRQSREESIRCRHPRLCSLPDFDIAREANGVRRVIYREFDVDVNGSTSEIHLYLTGQGITAIPIRGIYGPLISAIAVTPNYDVSTGSGGTLFAGAITGIVISSCVVVFLVLFVL
ncbi:Probable LRR receptor-like serine/threonine-protein kinase [Striga hermonthica]|uniref:non-specific serine/threonine protein kinase n=1 Tax=Striga hermonthica TaxID=68872 RepID=A0A9N7NK38_STRHE|nr:Probable LRR receptor-like serine/threonine-protein kinase [Striga hermonthica]